MRCLLSNLLLPSNETPTVIFGNGILVGGICDRDGDVFLRTIDLSSGVIRTGFGGVCQVEVKVRQLRVT